MLSDEPGERSVSPESPPLAIAPIEPTSAAESSSPSPPLQSPPQPRRSTRLSATPRTPPLNVVKRRSARLSSPLKPSTNPAAVNSDPSTPENQQTPIHLPPLPRGLHIVKKANGLDTGNEDAAPSAAQTRVKGKARATSPVDSLISDDDEVPIGGPNNPPPAHSLPASEKRERLRTRGQEGQELEPRRLGSLSPGSSTLLASLVPQAVEESAKKPPLSAPDFSVASEMPAELAPPTAAIIPLASNDLIPSTPMRPARVAFQGAVPQTPLNAFATTRPIPSPSRVLISPAKASKPGEASGSLQPPSTPAARRVPVSETIYAGTPMAQRPKTLAQNAVTSSKIVPPSPATFIPIGLPVHKPVRAMRREPVPAEIGSDAELTQPDVPLAAPPSLPTVDEAPPEVEPTATQPTTRIPSPVKSARPLPKPSGLPVPSKSALRQGSPGSSSRIPRIGAKPYTRPTPPSAGTTVTPASGVKGKAPARRAGEDSRATRPVTPGNGEESRSTTASSEIERPQEDAHIVHKALKRKREGEPALVTPALRTTAAGKSTAAVRSAPATARGLQPGVTASKPAKQAPTTRALTVPRAAGVVKRVLNGTAKPYVELRDEYATEYSHTPAFESTSVAGVAK
jgi:hypothetical protein